MKVLALATAQRRSVFFLPLPTAVREALRRNFFCSAKLPKEPENKKPANSASLSVSPVVKKDFQKKTPMNISIHKQG